MNCQFSSKRIQRMFNNLGTSIEVIQDAVAHQLYERLVIQLKKDIALANISIVLPETVTPKDLKETLHEKIYYLLLERFPEYLNLLYIIDVPEKAITNITGKDIVDLAEEVTFLILRREWQKVWFKSKYSS